MTLGENIKRIRHEKGLTQKQLGNLCNPPMADSAIRRYEAGKANPKIETIQKIADALNVSLDDLLPDSYDRDIQKGYELSTTDYGLIEAMANHKIFTDKERQKIFEKIEHYRSILVKINDQDKLLEYSSKTHTELENVLFKMLTNKPNYYTSNAIIILSCFLSLKGNDQETLIEMLLEYLYPNTKLKYADPPQD